MQYPFGRVFFFSLHQLIWSGLERLGLANRLIIPHLLASLASTYFFL